MKVWDYILSGIDYTKQTTKDVVIMDDDLSLYQRPMDDPLVNLEFLSVGMITLIKEDLMEADFSMCLGLLMSYKEPEDILSIVKRAEKIRDNIIHGKPY